MTGPATQRYRVEHHTAYRYEAPVTLSHQRLHLTPRPLTYQHLVTHEVVVTPAPTDRHDLTDSFGNPVTEITLESPHAELDVLARSIIEVRAREVPAATPPWETVRDALAYRAAWRPDNEVLEATQYLFESPHVRVKRDLRAYAAECFLPERPILDAARALMTQIHYEFEFDAKATTVTTPVTTFFMQRRGVCQDFSHFMVSCLRSVGLAARYVSGYLVTGRSKDKPELVGSEASHAWVSLFLPGIGWIDVDPTNDVFPGTDHVTLGWGRDFSDVTPLRGVIHGGGAQKLDVTVRVEPDEAAPSAHRPCS
jgi:transglutaminase-like putative cysteine protease